MAGDEEEGKGGVEILDGAVSTTSTADTHQMDKRNFRVDSANVSVGASVGAASNAVASKIDSASVGAVSHVGAASASNSAGPVSAPQSVAASSVEAEVDQGNTHAANAAGGGDGGDEEQQAALAAAGMDTMEPSPVRTVPAPVSVATPVPVATMAKEPQARATEVTVPYDEDLRRPSSSAVPVSHVAPQSAHHADDVSSLQHSHLGNEKGGSSYGADNIHGHYPSGRNEAQEQSREDAIEEGTSEYYEEEVEAQKALQRRNMLIIVMLLIFLGLVVAIGTGVGLAVKNDDAVPDDAREPDTAGPPPLANSTDDDGLGGGVELDISSFPSASPSNEGPCIPVEIGIIFDNYSDETGWMLVKGNHHPEDPDKNDVVWQSKYYDKNEFGGRADTSHACFSPGYYTFVFTDKEGDGVCCYHGEGSYVLSSEGKVITIGGVMDSDEETVAFELPFVAPEPVDADGDGRDDRLGHVLPYDSTGLIEGETCENFRLAIVTDEYGIETTWELYEGTDKKYGTLVANGGPYGSEYNYVVDYCLESPKRYALYVYDWDRRGLCCASGEGWFRVESGDAVIVDKTGAFGEENITRFVLPADGSFAFSGEPTSAPSMLATGGKKTGYPTVALVTKDPTPPTPPPTERESTPFPTLPGLDVVDAGGLPTTLGKEDGKDEKGKRR